MHDISDFFTKIQKADEPFVLPEYDIDKWDTYISFDYHWLQEIKDNSSKVLSRKSG